jgi:uncharacterized protein (DUF697 family)
VDTIPALDLVRPATDLDAASAGAESALVEIDAAIALVVGRAARRVRLVAVPFIEAVAGTGLARARAAGVCFAFERGDRAGVATVTVGPLEPAAAER